ncbi:hydrocephalus-inducing protein-like isoform X2 [Passer domesticus]|uniref:hydrocephalus-inducing protein-like isoform X2 n=1 Tax=Passer domesticus TaxID=48849 RepID=UPI0030FE75EC
MTPAVHEKRQTLEDEPCPFEVTPSKGTLDPGKWQNLHIQFTPKEERSYNNELEFNICGSSNHLKLHLSGQGLQPRLEFRPPALKMGWMLVDSDGVEATVVVKNPCNFPIEFYSLDFDEQCLEGEKILRMAVGSEYQKSFLMPPRAVGETLPPEVLEDYEAQKRPEAQREKLEAMAEAKARAEAKAKAKAMGKAAAELQWKRAMQRNMEHVLQMDGDMCNALPKEKKAEVDKIILEKKRIWRERELKQLAQKLEEKEKALEEQGRQKEEEKKSPWGSNLQNQRRGSPRPQTRRKPNPQRRKTNLQKRRKPNPQRGRKPKAQIRRKAKS